jgi:hypothetical protein
VEIVAQLPNRRHELAESHRTTHRSPALIEIKRSDTADNKVARPDEGRLASPTPGRGTPKEESDHDDCKNQSPKAESNGHVAILGKALHRCHSRSLSTAYAS